MNHSVAFKWLIITVITTILFLMILLFLGYLLKENEIATTKLKVKLEQEAYLQHEKESRKNTPFSYLQTSLSALEKSQQKIIAENLNCQSDKQCFLVHTHSLALGCIVAVNANGAAILLKISSMNENKPLASNCKQEYENTHEIIAQCQNSLCSF